MLHQSLLRGLRTIGSAHVLFPRCIAAALPVPSTAFSLQGPTYFTRWSSSSTEGKTRLKGAHYNKKTGKWTSSITVRGTRIHLGTFDTEEEASQAYLAAKSLYHGQLKQDKNRKPASKPETNKQYTGVFKVKGDAYEAVVEVNGNEISGGIYDDPEEAARAYDAMARMYFGPEAPVNFEVDPYSSWQPPEEQSKGPSTVIPVKEKVPLTVNEIVDALERERGINVQVLDLDGRSSLASYMVFVTGRSVSHMRKMGDMLVKALRDRKLHHLKPFLEGREMDDWMVVDMNDIIVNIFDEQARRVFDLENMYANMKDDTPPWEGLSFDEWLEKNPVPEEWLERIAKDEEEA